MGKIQQNICLTYYNQLHGIKGIKNALFLHYCLNFFLMNSQSDETHYLDDVKVRESTIQEWKEMMNDEELPNDQEVEMSECCYKGIIIS